MLNKSTTPIKMNYTPEQISEIDVNVPDLSKLSLDEKIELARNSNTPPETLIVLAKDEYSYVREAVKNNSNYKPRRES